MKIFLLEDSVERVRRFRTAFQQHNLVQSASASEAMVILAKEAFDLIFLDHDLNEHDTEWIAEGTGYEVANFLGATDTPNREALIAVHTMNPPGGERMMMALAGRRVCRTSIIALFQLGVNYWETLALQTDSQKLSENL